MRLHPPTVQCASHVDWSVPRTRTMHACRHERRWLLLGLIAKLQQWDPAAHASLHSSSLV